ncbi:carboxypeptidase-like regulatory domain-containing protein [Bernardetia sp. OM2101]|uniref:TonB-dependent receptor n=1 Tax=Bernardetia sp. OM2101 TaxID=3344876 RepID=UPI0035D10666
MYFKKLLVFFALFFIFQITTFAQTNSIKGKVVDSNNQPIFAANVYSSSFPNKGTTTDFDGNFILSSFTYPDTLLVSYIGYETYKIYLEKSPLKDSIFIVLEGQENLLNQMIITAKNPISEEFSVIKLEKMDIYTNPISAGDPLKAITALPSSTNTDESANPVLRGSSSDRSRVILNGVPVYKPVRNGQINGLGNFSLFNAEMIDKQYVYASNPPLTYGNTSAGLIEIQTNDQLDYNHVQASLSLANIGGLVSRKLGENTFIQVYGNYQFPDAFLKLNEKRIENLIDFTTKDAGLNFHSNLTDKSSINSFSYFIDESYIATRNSYSYEGQNDAQKNRFFSINNYSLKGENYNFKINTLVDFSKQDYNFGNLTSQIENKQSYISLDYKYLLLKTTSIQTGISYDYSTYNFNDSLPEYYYANAPTDPNYFYKHQSENNNIEAYIYSNWNINDKLTMSSGFRSNIPTQEQDYYLSTQMSFNYKPNKKNNFILSGGRYHNYTTPSFIDANYFLLQSLQFALDYSYSTKKVLFTTAVYHKYETGNFKDLETITFDKAKITGFEVFMKHNLTKKIDYSLSNTFINQQVRINENYQKGANQLNYLIKASITYSNPKLFTAALFYIDRPGTYFTSIDNGIFRNETNTYEPVFSSTIYNQQLNSYKNLNLNISRFFPFGKYALVLYASVNNILDRKNEQNALYSFDYQNQYFNNFQGRTFYMGLVWQLNK